VHNNQPTRHRPSPNAPVVGSRLVAYRQAPQPADHVPTEPLYVNPPTYRSARPPQSGRRPDHPPSQRRGEPDDAGGRRRDTTRRTDTELARIVAGLASLAAGIIHIGATPGHWDEWRAAGLFFAGTAAFQILWAVLIMTVGGLLLATIGILGSLGVIGTWAVSRQWGVPFGPHAGVPEAVGLADTLATLLAGVVAAVLLWSQLPRERHGVLSAGGYRLALIGAALVMTTAAVPGTVNALDPGHSHGGEAEGGHGAAGDDHHGDGADMDIEVAPDTDDTEPDAPEPEEPAPSTSVTKSGSTNDDGHDHTH
jgi:hypothetical protein